MNIFIYAPDAIFIALKMSNIQNLFGLSILAALRTDSRTQNCFTKPGLFLLINVRQLKVPHPSIKKRNIYHLLPWMRIYNLFLSNDRSEDEKKTQPPLSVPLCLRTGYCPAEVNELCPVIKPFSLMNPVHKGEAEITDMSWIQVNAAFQL